MKSRTLRNIAPSYEVATRLVRDLVENGVRSPRRVFAGLRACVPVTESATARSVPVWQPWRQTYSMFEESACQLRYALR
jgi:hypothetical protein